MLEKKVDERKEVQWMKSLIPLNDLHVRRRNKNEDREKVEKSWSKMTGPLNF